jgi:hypothetical protein
MAHIINNQMNVPSNKVTLHTTGTYADQDVEINNSVTLGSLTNSPSNGQTYTEDTSTNTVLPAGGYLYINKGWHDNIKISLGHLIPEIADKDAGKNEILNGYKAYDENGNVITGTMSTVEPTFTGGGITATASGSVTTAPKVTVTQSFSSAASTTYGFTSTAPSGTEGTNYLKIDATGTPTAGSVTATAKAESAAVTFAQTVKGFLDKTAGATALPEQTAIPATKSISVTPTVTDNAAPVYVPIVTPTFAGGAVNGKAEVSVTNPSVTVSTAMSTGAADYGVTTTQPTSGEYISITASQSSSNGKATASAAATRDAVTFSNAAGAIKANSGATALAALPSSATTLTGAEKNIVPTVTTTNFKNHYIPKATIKAVPGTPTITAPTASASVAVATNGNGTVSGVLTSAPSGNYIKITPGVTLTAGSAKSNASAAANSAGVISTATTGGSVSGTAATVSVTNNTPASAARYIEIYDGSYTIS